jgi:hypothetical protein
VIVEDLAAGQCVRVVPTRLKPGALQSWLVAHREHHTPAVRRQAGFLAKLLMQSEAEPDCAVMLLIWQTPEQAIAWTKHPEHDAIAERVRDLTGGGAGSIPAAPRGGYRLLDVITAA